MRCLYLLLLRWPPLAHVLPQRPADKERPQPLQVQRRLLGLAHALHDRRQRVQLRPQQPDHEVVVVLVQPVARQPDVRAVARPAIGVADAAVLHQDRALLRRRQLLERPRPPQRVPDRPRPLGVAHLLDRPRQQHALQVVLVAQRIGAPQHRVFGLGRQLREGRPAQKWPQRVEEEVGVLAEGEQRHAKGIVDVFVQHACQSSAACSASTSVLGFRAVAKDHQLHKQPAVEGELPPVGRVAPLADIDAFRGKGLTHELYLQIHLCRRTAAGSYVQNGSSSRYAIVMP